MVAEGRAEGMEQGMERGIERGRAEGVDVDFGTQRAQGELAGSWVSWMRPLAASGLD